MTSQRDVLDEHRLLQAERDSVLRMIEEKNVYVEQLERDLATAQRERAAATDALEPLRREVDATQRQNQELLAQLATLEKLRRFYRRVPGGMRMARLVKRSLH
jgi:arginine deiminase